MIEAKSKDRERIIEILTLAFEQSKYINAFIKQDDKKLLRIRALMQYSCWVCNIAGKVILSDDRDACALVLYPDKMGFSIRAMGGAFNLLVGDLGIAAAIKVLRRQARIKKHYPSKSYYIWLIAVHPVHRNFGYGRSLMEELIDDAERKGRAVCLEVPASKHLSWCRNRGFEIFHELEVDGYSIYLLKKLKS